MIEVFPFETLGRLNAGWLDAHYHFSFADYFDPVRRGFGPLRVWNDDRIRPGGGFPMHPHRDFEIVTYVRQGAVTHEDSLGHQGRTAAGDVQVMSAGTGIVHSEYNRGTDDLELFQIWVRPDRAGHAPRWETRHFATDERRGRLLPLVSGQVGVPAPLALHQDVTLYAAELAPGERIEHALARGRGAYLVPARGEIAIDGEIVGTRAGIVVRDQARLGIEAQTAAEIVLMDLAVAER